MKFRILDANGEPLIYLDAPEDEVEINVPPGGRFERLSDGVDLLSLPVRPPRPRTDDPETQP
jgi:hypothetical protein